MHPSPSLFRISKIGSDIVVSFLDAYDGNPIVRFRQQEILRALNIKLSQLGTVVAGPEYCSVQVTVSQQESARRVNDVLTSLLYQATRILQQPCTPKMVMELLRIGSKERLRWTKDGRLKTVGRLATRNGNSAACRTYAADDIVELMRHPEIIEQWRQADASAGAH